MSLKDLCSNVLMITHFAIHSLPMAVLSEPQISDMAVFHKCPVCGEFAFIQPELGGEEYKAFKCENGHEFKNPINKGVKEEDKEVWDKMPERQNTSIQRTSVAS